MSERDGTPLRVQVLGAVRAWRGDYELELGAPLQRAVLAMLAMRAGQTVSQAGLIDGLWAADPPPSAVNAVHGYIRGLRAALEPGRLRRAPGRTLVATGRGYLLRLEPGDVDACVFGQRLDEARSRRAAGDLAAAARSAETALDLWHGGALLGLPGPWAEIERVRLEELRLAAIEERAGIMLAHGSHAEAAAELAALVREHPLREALRGQFMLALYRCGRQAEALAAFTEARQVLVGELGIEPGPELQRLHQRILAADSALDPPVSMSAAAVPLPLQLPAGVSGFTGRGRELAELDAQLAACQRDEAGAMMISVISGTAGVGKTTLAVRWARQASSHFPDGQMYVNLRGYDPDQPVLPADALAGFLRALGLAGEAIPASTDERAAAYRTMLDGRRMLLLLDNAATAEQVRPLLPGAPSCAVLITSRDWLAGLVAGHGAQRLSLATLPVGEAVALLGALVGERATADLAAAAAFAERCARLPLALRVAAEFAAARPDMTLASLAAELADERHWLDMLDEAGGDSRTAVRSVFSWSYRQMAAGAARVFRLLGLHPGGDFDALAVAALSGATLAQGKRIIGELARANMIERACQDRYAMHDLLRAYAAGLAVSDGEATIRQALTRLFDHYLGSAAVAMDALVPAENTYRPQVPRPVTAPPVTDAAAARAWLDAHRPTLVAVAAHAATHGWPTHATRLAATLNRYLEIGCHYADAVTIHTHALQAARRTGDAAGEASSHTNLGIIDLRQGRFQQAADHHEQALNLSIETGDRMTQGIAESNLGGILYRLGRDGEAVAHLKRAVELSREVGDRLNEAMALGNLGCACQRQGRIGQAAEYLWLALAIFRETGHRKGQADVLIELGSLSRRQGRHRTARQHLEHAIDLFDELGDRSSKAETLNGLGETLLAAGQPGQARTHYLSALALSCEIGDRHEQGRAHSGLARTHRAAGELGLAAGRWQRALACYDGLGLPAADKVRAELAALGASSQAGALCQAGARG